MDYQVRYRAIRDDKILCEVVGLDEQRRPTGPVAARGIGNTKQEAAKVALASATDPGVQRALESATG
jgi:hypothetical protein